MTILVEEVQSLLSASQPGVPWLDFDIPLLYGEADMSVLLTCVFAAPPNYPVLKGRDLIWRICITSSFGFKIPPLRLS